MAKQGIPRHNGKNFVGDYDAIVSGNDADGDVKGKDGTVASGRFCHSFELYVGRPVGIMRPNTSFVLIIEFHDELNGSFREGEKFADIPAMSKFVREYDPISRVPADCRTQEAVSQLVKRYKERSKRFLNLAEERVPTRLERMGQRRE